MDRVSCEIVQDLLPLYYDDVCSAESREMIDAHIRECETCSDMLRQLKSEYTVSDKEREENREGGAVLGKLAHSWKHSLWKSFFIGIAITVVVLPLVIFGIYKGQNSGYDAFMALGCDAEEYTEEAGEGYLSLKIDTPSGTVIRRIKVENADARALLSTADLETVIGVNMLLHLPKQRIAENHMNMDTIDPFDLLLFSDAYNDCFSIIEVFVE